VKFSSDEGLFSMSTSRWLLENVPLSLLMILAVAGLAGITVLAATTVRRRVSGVTEGRYDDTAKTVLTYLLTVYSLVLAFVIVNENEGYNQAEVDVQSEALNIEDFYRVTSGLSDPAAGDLTNTVRDYVSVVVDEEWDLLAEGKASAEASDALARLFDIMRSYDPVGSRESTLYDAGLDYLHSTHEARHRRVNSASNALPPPLSAFLIVGAIAIMGVSCLLGGKQRQQLLVPLSLGCLLGFTLLLTLMLAHPFSGKYAISSEHFRQGQLVELLREPPHD